MAIFKEVQNISEARARLVTGTVRFIPGDLHTPLLNPGHECEPRVGGQKLFPIKEGITPPLIIPRDERGRIRWKILKENPEKLASDIESEIRELVRQGVQLSHRGLLESGFSYLTPGIRGHYPDSFAGLRRSLGLPEGNNPKNYWAKDGSFETIRAEARGVILEVGTLSVNILRRSRKDGLLNAIAKYYPRGISGLKKDLEVKTDTRPRGYWTVERMLEEGEAIFRQHGKLTRKLMKGLGKTDLASVVHKYPGGIEGLKVAVGLVSHEKPRGFWTPENIRAEARAFFEQTGSLSQGVMTKYKRSDLIHAVWIKYPGGIRQLQRDLEVKIQTRKPDGYWSQQTIKEEAAAFFEQTGRLTSSFLEKNGRSDLAQGIALYPGGIRQLQVDLGVPMYKKPNGFWTPENTEREAREFYNSNGVLTLASIRSKYSGLWSALRNYPGGIEALKEKIGIFPTSSSVEISADEANAALDSLFKEENG